MLQVKLSEKPCLFCGKLGQSLQAKSKEHDFQGIICPEHLIIILKKWEKEEAQSVSTS